MPSSRTQTRTTQIRHDKTELAFNAGNYRSVLDSLGRKAIYSYPLNVFQIGSMIFLGELTEAELLIENYRRKKRYHTVSQIEINFFLGVGYVRTSRYDEAEKLFLKNLRLVKQLPKNFRAQAFAYQGLAFFRFFEGQFRESLDLAQKAYAMAYQANHLYAQVLALDLLGYCYCHLGEVHKGLAEFQKALEICHSLGNSGIAAAIRISKIIFKSQYGIDFQNGMSKLKSAIKNLDPQDTYSQAELYLELARQQILRGKTSQAQQTLDFASQWVYRHLNRRQYALFNLRYAHVLFLKGETNAARTLLQSAQSNLNMTIDRLLKRKIDGLLAKITGTPLPITDSVNFIDQRILCREAKIPSVVANAGQDPLGDWIDRAQTGDLAILPELCRLNLLGLVAKVLNISSVQNTLILGPYRASAFIISKGDVQFIPSGISFPMQKILLSLGSQSFVSKQQLVATAWNYHYSPEPHDRLLHATIGKIRKILGPFAHWIEWTQLGYKLMEGVSVISMLNNAHQNDLPIRDYSQSNLQSNDLMAWPNANQLNHRQVQALQMIKSGVFFNTSSYAKKFKVSNMTACRDLTSLFQQGLVVKFGRARATLYGPAPVK